MYGLIGVVLQNDTAQRRNQMAANDVFVSINGGGGPLHHQEAQSGGLRRIMNLEKTRLIDFCHERVLPSLIEIRQ
jgi:hypothetical protein